MNQHALVFAADSATTVTYWRKGQRESRYFKGANKLFQLSSEHPVGLMIYGSATLHDVPWELVVKEFRGTKGSTPSDKLAGYLQKFCEFVKGHAGLFPAAVRKKALVDYALLAAYVEATDIKQDDKIVGAKPEQREAVYRDHVLKVLEMVRNAVPPEPLTIEDVQAAVAAHQDEVTNGIAADAEIALEVPDLQSTLAEIAIRSLLTRYEEFLNSTGIVIGGYGEDEFFPSFEVCECYGFLDQHFLVKRSPNSRAVSRDIQAAIEPFATTSMINTFRMGIGPDVFGSVVSATQRTLKSFAEELIALVAPGTNVPDLEDRIGRFVNQHRDEWFGRTRDDHYNPLARVISSLPVTEMAALAKSLIELQSLKERVTEPTESVAGPIDVAVISKHDGFVWIERKHYFRPELNPRFFLRQKTIGGA